MPVPAYRQALKVVFGRLVRACGGQEAAVQFTRLSRHQALSDFANPSPDHAARFPPVDVVADLEAISHGTDGHPIVTRTLARLAGYDLVPLPRPRDTGTDFATHLQAIIRETAEVTMGLSKHLKQGPGPNEAAKIRAEVAEAILALVELDAALAQLGGE